MNEPSSIIVTHPTMIASMSMVEDYTKNVMNNLLDPFFTDHSVQHCHRITKIIDSILLQNNKTDLLSEIERYILRCSILLHDIGMQSNIGIQDSFQRRDIHHLKSSEIINDQWERIGLIEQFVPIIALVAKGHRGNIDEEYDDKIIGTFQSVRCDLLASLLYLGDELDITYERVDIRRQSLIDAEEESALHFFKHYYTQGINIQDNRCLSIVFRYPNGRTNQYHPLFAKNVIDKINNIILKLTPILQDKHRIIVILRDEDIKVTENPALESVNPDLFLRISSLSLGIKSFTFLDRIKFNEFKGDIDAELFYKGNIRWADIVNELDIRRDAYNYIMKSIVELHSISMSNRTFTCLLISGAGGAGKTTLLNRLAYDSIGKTEFEKINLLWHNLGKDFNINELRSLFFENQSPVIVFADGFNIVSIIEEIHHYINDNGTPNFPLTLIFAARLNEWTDAGGPSIPFNSFVETQLDKLTENEIIELLEKLEAHDQLYQLAYLKPQERLDTLRSKSDYQLLVAMLEATRGRRFEEIVIDEYQNIRRGFPSAAIAYEFVCLFYIYDVMIPLELLITLVQCCDNDEFESKVLKHTHLVIVRDNNIRNKIYYRPRHKEIAKILIDNLEEYRGNQKRLKKLLYILRILDVTDRSQRYVIINFLNNLVSDVKKNKPRAEYVDSMEEIRSFIIVAGYTINLLCKEALRGNYIGELISWSRLFRELRLTTENLAVLEYIVSIDRYSKVSNYLLAKLLIKSKSRRYSSLEIADYFKHSFLGGNRDIYFLYDYMSYCLKHGLNNHLDSLVDSFYDFVAYTDDDNKLRIRLEAIIKGYKRNKDKDALADKFSDINQNLTITKELSVADELAYIDFIESMNVKETLKNYIEYLITIDPNRPKSVLLRIAHTAAKIVGEESTAIQYYKEIFDKYIGPNLCEEDFEIIFEFATFAKNKKLQSKEINYKLFRLCKQLKPFNLKVYVEFAIYAISMDDGKFAMGLLEEGLSVATKISKYDSLDANEMKKLLYGLSN
jgi:hypothetical protein